MKKLLVLFPNQLFSEKLLPKECDLVLLKEQDFFEKYNYHSMKRAYLFICCEYYLKEIKKDIKVLNNFDELLNFSEKYNSVYFFDPVNLSLDKKIKKYKKNKIN